MEWQERSVIFSNCHEIGKIVLEKSMSIDCLINDCNFRRNFLIFGIHLEISRDHPGFLANQISSNFCIKPDIVLRQDIKFYYAVLNPAESPTFLKKPGYLNRAWYQTFTIRHYLNPEGVGSKNFIYDLSLEIKLNSKNIL